MKTYVNQFELIRSYLLSFLKNLNFHLQQMKKRKHKFFVSSGVINDEMHRTSNMRNEEKRKKNENANTHTHMHTVLFDERKQHDVFGRDNIC